MSEIEQGAARSRPAVSPISEKTSEYNNKSISIGDGGALIILETDVEYVLDKEMAKNPRLRDFFEGNWDSYDFESFLEGFTAFYDELHKIGFSDNQKDAIFGKAGIVGWSKKTKDEKTLLYRQARNAIKEKRKKAKEEEEEEEFKRKAYFEKDGKLYLEILTRNGEYKFAYDAGDVELQDIVDDIAPVELPLTANGERADIVKMPDETITSCRVLEPDELLQKVKAHIAVYCDMPMLDRDICSYYVLFTWFWTKANTRGYLRFIADTGKGKTRMQEVTGDLCFYPTTAGGSGSFSGLFRTHELWHGTLIIDEGDTKEGKDAKAIKYLNLGFQDNKWFILSDKKNPKHQEVFNPAGPKVIAMREHFRDNALEGRLISISTHETTNEDINPLLDEEYVEKTRKLRNEIARFTLAHWSDVDGKRMMEFKGLGLEPRLRQMAMPISVIFQLWTDGKEEFKRYIQARQRELKKDRALSFEGSLFNLVYAIATGDEELKEEFGLFYDGDEIEAITPSMVAKLMNTKPRTATDVLRSIGFDVELKWITLGKTPEKSTEAEQQQIEETPAKPQEEEEEEKKTEGKTWKPKRKRVRTYVVPNGKTWREIFQRYYYNEDEKSGNSDIEIPDVLRSRKYVDSVLLTVPTVPSVPHNENGTDGTDGTDVGTPGGGKIINTEPKNAQGKRKTETKTEKPTKFVNIDDVENDGNINPRAFDTDFQTKQDLDARRQRDKERKEQAKAGGEQ